MTAATRSLATALWGARFASGLLPLSYTTRRDTTQSNPLVSLGVTGDERVSAQLSSARTRSARTA